jgi:hypothetical protein
MWGKSWEILGSTEAKRKGPGLPYCGAISKSRPGTHYPKINDRKAPKDGTLRPCVIPQAMDKVY